MPSVTPGYDAARPFFDMAEPIVAMIEFKGRLIVASALHLYEVNLAAGKLQQIDLQIDLAPWRASAWPDMVGRP